MKKVAFLIAALNEEKNIGNCIDSINKSKYKNKEILVVDGGSKDRTVEIAKSKGAKVIAETGENKCPANAWNQAIKYTDAELICLIAADFLVPDEKFIEKVTAPFDNPKVACVSTCSKVKENTLVEKIVSCLDDSTYQNIIIKREIALRIGGFPVIGFGEDRIFNIRFLSYVKNHNLLSERVYDTYYSGHTVQTLSALFKQSRWYGRTSLIYLKQFYKESASFLDRIKETATVNFKMCYFLLFAISFFSIKTQFFYYFFAPFAIIALITVLKNIKKPYHTLKIFTNIISGGGFFIGILLYVFGTNRAHGRG